jgi:hypothetical protein
MKNGIFTGKAQEVLSSGWSLVGLMNCTDAFEGRLSYRTLQRPRTGALRSKPDLIDHVDKSLSLFD